MGESSIIDTSSSVYPSASGRAWRAFAQFESLEAIRLVYDMFQVRCSLVQSNSRIVLTKRFAVEDCGAFAVANHLAMETYLERRSDGHLQSVLLLLKWRCSFNKPMIALNHFSISSLAGKADQGAAATVLLHDPPFTSSSGSPCGNLTK